MPNMEGIAPFQILLWPSKIEYKEFEELVRTFVDVRSLMELESPFYQIETLSCDDASENELSGDDGGFGGLADLTNKRVKSSLFGRKRRHGMGKA